MLGVASGQFVTKQNLYIMGTNVTFIKIDKETYVMDFLPNSGAAEPLNTSQIPQDNPSLASINHFAFYDVAVLGCVIGDHGIAEFFKGAGFDLADALAAHFMFLAQFFQRGGGLTQAARC